ncbi:MAG: hypothetical protein IPN32_34070 [Deltaproteobacteria bacterium]|nr:hypothetical protein [Deltaproteobacteria bacterium]
MPNYRIIYMDGKSTDIDDRVLTLVNRVPSPLPPPNQPWTSYQHNGKIVRELRTTGPSATLVVVAGDGGAVGEQNVRMALCTTAGHSCSAVWQPSAAGVQLDLRADAASTGFDITDMHLPPQALRVVLMRPTL